MNVSYYNVPDFPTMHDCNLTIDYVRYYSLLSTIHYYADDIDNCYLVCGRCYCCVAIDFGRSIDVQQMPWPYANYCPQMKHSKSSHSDNNHWENYIHVPLY